MDLDALEYAAILYYCSRGIPPRLVATFLNDRFKRGLHSSGSIYRIVRYSPFQASTGWDFSDTNPLILENVHRGKMKWEQFLARLNFTAAEETLLEESKVFNDIVNTKSREDSLVTQFEAEFVVKNPHLFAGTPATTSSSFRAAPPLPVPAITTGGQYGIEWGRRIGTAMETSVGPDSSPYKPLGWGPEVPAGKSTSTPGEGSQQRSSESAARESGPSNTASTTGRTDPSPGPR